MLGASSLDDGRKMDSIVKAMSSTSSCDDFRKMDSILKATSRTSGGDDGRKLPKGQGASSVKEADLGGNRNKRKGVEEAEKGGYITLKKGAWTPAEDAILKEFVKNHGEGNWNAVQKYSGLPRCGKSCRFRWANHLKPNLKKGAFTAEEEQRIFELHASMGNKWSKIAAKLPGRTDNEIKNFWNTRVRRSKRAGLTTNPEEVEIYRQQVQNEAGQHDSISQTESDDISDVEFRRLKSDMSSQQYNMLPMMHPSKRLRGSDMIYNSFDPSVVPTFDQFDTSDPMLLSQYDPIFNTSVQFGNFHTGSHASLNGTISASSEPLYGANKLDLPSFQNSKAHKDIWHMPESSLPPLESVDTPDSSIEFQSNQSVLVTHQNNDGLLESIFYGSKDLNGSNNVDSLQQNNDHFVPYEAIQDSTLNLNGLNDVDSFEQNNDHCVPYEAIQNSTLNPSETQWDGQEVIRSSLGPHAASVQGFHKVEHPSFHYLEAQKRIWHTNESSFPPLGESVDTAECSIQLHPNQPVPVSDQNNVDSFQENNVDSSQENNDHCVLNKTTKDHGDKHGALTEFPTDSPSPENQNLIEFFMEFDPAPYLSFMENDSLSPEIQNLIKSLSDPDLAPDLSFMKDDSSSPENQSPTISLLNPDAALGLSFMENKMHYLSQFPEPIWRFVDNIINVKGDGNCGFRCISSLLNWGQNSWQKVRNELMEEMDNNWHLYSNVMGDEVQTVRDSLVTLPHLIQPPQKWMSMPDTGHVIATRYQVALVILSPTSATCFTFFPLRGEYVPSKSRLLCVGFVDGNHWVQIMLNANSPLPPVHPSWGVYSSQETHLWFSSYVGRIEFWRNLFPNHIMCNRRDIVEYIDIE